MKKVFTIIIFALCTLYANAQYQNPYACRDDEYVNLKVTTDYRLAGSDKKNVILPQDTIIGLGHVGLIFYLEYWLQNAPQEAVDYVSDVQLTAQIRDYYGAPVINSDDDSVWVYEYPKSRLDVSAKHVIEDEGVQFGIGQGGHYNWDWKLNRGGIAQSGHIQVNSEPKVAVSCKSQKFTAPVPHAPMVIRSMVNTGFPYDFEKYQGNTKYTIFDPDSNVVCQQEIKLNLSPDRKMMEQSKEVLVCTIDSAAAGIYNVLVEAPYLQEPLWCHFTVEDELSSASSNKGVDATLRLKEYSFASRGEGKGWVYNGTATPTYYVKNEGHFNSLSTMTVRSEKNKPGGAFSLTQTVNDMPKGFYTLEQPIVYQPCKLSEMDKKAEILAHIEVNGVKADAVNIMEAAEVKTDVDGDGGEYLRVAIPANDVALVKTMYEGNSRFNAKVTFEVLDDGILNIAINKAASTMTDDMTVIGEPVLKYYGSGLPYGRVMFPGETQFKPGDNIIVKVSLSDGVGKAVPSDNVITAFVAPVTAEGLDLANPLVTDEVSAGSQGVYDVTLAIPEEAKAGTYAMAVASLENGDDFEIMEMMQIEISGTTGVQQAMTNAGNGSDDAYTLSGIKLSTTPKTDGIYIKGGRKIVNSNK